MKATVVPAHTGLAEAAIETLTGNNGFTVIVNEFEVAGLPEAQETFDVSRQAIISPFNGI